MTHWHIWRLGLDSANMATEHAIDADFFFAWNRYPTVAAAYEAVRKDVLKKYPQAKTFAALETLKTIPPGSGVHYKVNSHHFVTWQLAECSGRRCKKVRRSAERFARAFLAEKLGITPTLTRDGKKA